MIKLFDVITIEDRESSDNVLGNMEIFKVIKGNVILEGQGCEFKYTFINKCSNMEMIEEHIIDVFNFDGKTNLSSSEIKNLKQEIKEIVAEEDYLL